jgi:putative Ca2+/H+ antiporter (TMEM165/GDT1 family)
MILVSEIGDKTFFVAAVRISILKFDWLLFLYVHTSLSVILFEC